MIEELTPQLLMVAVLLLAVVVPIVALLLSAVLLYRYRVAVRAAMSASVGFDQDARRQDAHATIGAEHQRNVTTVDEQALFGRMRQGPWRQLLRYLVPGLAVALMYTAAAHVAYPHQLGIAGSSIALWIYLWPYFVVAPLIVPARPSLWAMWFLGYMLIYALLGAWAATVQDIPAYRFGAIEIPARSSVTPQGMAKLWLVVNAPPTLLVIISFNRWVRAVAPLMLALVAAAVTGVLAVYFATFSKQGADVVVQFATTWQLPIQWLLLLILAVTLAVFGTLGWWVMRRIARTYHLGRISDQDLLLGAVWALFAASFTMWLVIDNTAWIAVLPLALVTAGMAARLVHSVRGKQQSAPHGLTFLRVFSLGTRSQRVFNALAKHWRYVGSVQLITGPDLATSTVQPHQFLDFLSGHLRRHFVADASSLHRSLAERDRGADPDGRYRINNFFCYEDSWKAALPQLVRAGDTVLLDLRSFSTDNAGCTHELQFLVSDVPYRCCLLLVDRTTDERLVDDIISRTSRTLPPDSPNYGQPTAELRRLRVPFDRDALAPLLTGLAEAEHAGTTSASLRPQGN